MDFLWRLHCTPNLLSGAHGFSEDISHPSWGMICDRSVFWQDHSRHPLWLPDRHTVQAQFTTSPGVWSRQTRSEARTTTVMKRMWSLGSQKMDVFINLTRKSFGGQESEGKEMGWNWVSPWFYFVEWEAETLLETSFSHCSRGWFDRRDFLESRDILHTPPSSSHLQLFWGFLTIQEPKRKKQNKTKKKGHKAWIFSTSFQILLAGLILLLFSLLWYFLSSFMDPRGLFTCDITETLSSQECAYPVQSSLIAFYLLQEATPPNHWWCLDSHWLVWVSQFKENVQKQRQH